MHVVVDESRHQEPAFDVANFIGSDLEVDVLAVADVDDHAIANTQHAGVGRPVDARPDNGIGKKPVDGHFRRTAWRSMSGMPRTLSTGVS